MMEGVCDHWSNIASIMGNHFPISDEKKMNKLSIY